jgi:hypothetical protein
MANMANLEDLEMRLIHLQWRADALLKSYHLPGQHPQKRHGRRRAVSLSDIKSMQGELQTSFNKWAGRFIRSQKGDVSAANELLFEQDVGAGALDNFLRKKGFAPPTPDNWQDWDLDDVVNSLVGKGLELHGAVLHPEEGSIKSLPK